MGNEAPVIEAAAGVLVDTTRAAVVPVRLTRGERDQLADVARDMGLSLSAYVRQVVLSRPLPPRRAVRPIPEVNREAYASLAHALANLNQVARRLNERGADEPQTQELVAVLTLLAREVRELQASFLGTSLSGSEAQS
jgi:hypothetical protein